MGDAGHRGSGVLLYEAMACVSWTNAFAGVNAPK